MLTITLWSNGKNSLTTRLTPICKPNLSRCCKKAVDVSFTATSLSFLPGSHSESDVLEAGFISPAALGIGSPCGSNLGKPRNSSSRSISFDERICYSSSATSCTSSQENFSFSCRNTSHNRCLRIICKAKPLPVLLSCVFLYFS